MDTETTVNNDDSVRAVQRQTLQMLSELKILYVSLYKLLK